MPEAFHFMLLPAPERERVVISVRQLEFGDIPGDFLEALDDFEKGRFVSMANALNEAPPKQ